MKVSLYSKCFSYDFKKLFESKGYTWFDKGVYNLNIIGIRRANKNKVTNTYDDVLETISEIFSCDGIYKIPNYQRQYSWTNDQLEALWDDLYEAYQKDF